ncbi:rhodanese-like domain-containing protein [Streptomyces collinus]|nr:hypothetical protein GCM10010309_80660 [Streptomyces violaceochromogenes]
MTAWLADGNPQTTTAFLTADRADGRPYVDVRQEAEFAAGHVPGAVHIELSGAGPGRVGQRFGDGGVGLDQGVVRRAHESASRYETTHEAVTPK